MRVLNAKLPARADRRQCLCLYADLYAPGYGADDHAGHWR